MAFFDTALKWSGLSKIGFGRSVPKTREKAENLKVNPAPFIDSVNKLFERYKLLSAPKNEKVVWSVDTTTHFAEASLVLLKKINNFIQLFETMDDEEQITYIEELPANTRDELLKAFRIFLSNENEKEMYGWYLNVNAQMSTSTEPKIKLFAQEISEYIPLSYDADSLYVRAENVYKKFVTPPAEKSRAELRQVENELYPVKQETLALPLDEGDLKRVRVYLQKLSQELAVKPKSEVQTDEEITKYAGEILKNIVNVDRYVTRIQRQIDDETMWSLDRNEVIKLGDELDELLSIGGMDERFGYLSAALNLIVNRSPNPTIQQQQLIDSLKNYLQNRNIRTAFLSRLRTVRHEIFEHMYPLVDKKWWEDGTSSSKRNERFSNGVNSADREELDKNKIVL